MTNTFPSTNSGGTMGEEYNKVIREMANLFGVTVVEWAKCGYNFYNLNLYAQENSGDYKQHPNRFGHSLLANELIKTIDPSCKNLYPTRIPIFSGGQD